VIRLLGVEMRRDLARRATRLLVLAFLLATVGGIAIAWANIETGSDASVAAAEQQAIDRCIEHVTTFGVPSGPPATFELEGGPTIEVPTPTETEVLDPDAAEARCQLELEMHLRGELGGSGLVYYEDPRPNIIDFWDPQANENSFFGGIQTLLALVALGAAASMIGAEWKAGTITTQLTWFPGRVPLFLTKVVAAVVLAVAIAFVLQVVFAALVVGLVAGKNGVMDAADGAWWANLFAGMGRTCFLVGVAAALGASLAMLFRNTAGAVLVVFVYVAVAEQLLRVWQPDWERWFIGPNFAIVLTGHALEGVDWTKEPLAAAATLLVYVAVAIVLAAVMFQRRDIAGAG
jgi:ABC-2 type transport system permease protein